MLAAVLFRLVSGMAFVVMAVLVKVCSKSLPIGEVVFFRGLVAFAFMVTLASFRLDLASLLRSKNVALQMSRGALGVLAMTSSYASFAMIQLAQAQAFVFLTPIFAAVFGLVFLKEQGTYRLALGLLFGFVGVILAWSEKLHGGIWDSSFWGMAAGLLGAVLAGISLLLVRRLATTDNVRVTMTFFALMTVILTSVTCPFGWKTPSGFDSILLATLGLIGVVGHYCLVQSMARAGVVETAALEYFNMIWALGLGLVLFDETPSGRELLGAVMVMGAAWIARPKLSTSPVSGKKALEHAG